MTDRLKVQLQDSISIIRENKQLKAENDLLRARLRIADLKLQRRSDVKWPIDDLNVTPRNL